MHLFKTFPGQACIGGEMEGCMVSAAGGEVAGQPIITWVRGCCTGPLCTEIHEETSVGGVTGRMDQTWSLA